MRQVKAGGWSTNVTSVCQWLAANPGASRFPPGRAGLAATPASDAQGERAEALGERDLPCVAEILIAQKDHLVVKQRLPNLGDNVVAERVIGVDAADLGTDVALASLVTKTWVWLVMVSVTVDAFRLGVAEAHAGAVG